MIEMGSSRTYKRIFLSPPWVDASERRAVEAAFRSGYVAPCGPQVDEFESALAALAGRRYAVAVSSGTAAIDLVMAHLGVDSSWTVVAPTLTFMATVGPAYHRGARLVFVDSDASGGIDASLLEKALRDLGGCGRTLVMGVDLYGRCCDYAAISRLCRKAGAVFVSDSAEAVGATFRGRPAGCAGVAGIYSFNGNKIITTSGGGAVVTDSKALADHVRKLAQQSREKCVWYEHREVGYNYRMSNLLASVGLAQLSKLPSILEKRKAISDFYHDRFGKPGSGPLSFLPPVEGENHWLTVALAPSGELRDEIIAGLSALNVESRPVWKPMHLQPVFAGCRMYGGGVSEDLFRRGVCLPSGTGLARADLARIAKGVSAVVLRGGRGA